MTTEEAMIAAEAILGVEADSAPEIMRDLKKDFDRTPLFHQQLPLLPDVTEPEMEAPERGRKRAPQPFPLPPAAPLPQHLRVEVWRESKNSQRKIRVIRL